MKIFGETCFDSKMDEILINGEARSWMPRQKDVRIRQEAAKAAALVMIADELHGTREEFMKLRETIDELTTIIRCGR